MRVRVLLFATVAIVCAGGLLSHNAHCLPEIYLYVNDFSNVLLQSEINELDDLCAELDSLTTDEIAVVTVNDTQPEGIALYAVELFQSAGIGKQGKDNGVLVLLATGEEQWRIEVGYGLEGILNDAKVGAIGRQCLAPNIERGDYFAGLYDTVYYLAENLTADESRIVNQQKDPGICGICGIDSWMLWVPFIIFIVIAIITKGRVFLWVGSLATRGRFGGGRSGGGGAAGRL